MSQALPLHLALLLVPYLEPADIARSQQVCKVWQSVFTSQKLLHTTLRTHFPFSHEVRNLRTHPFSPLPTFTLVSRRYAALKSGTPQQELRVPIYKTRRDIYVWTFAENLLVYQSSHHPRAILSLIYLDYSSSPRRIRTGTITLDARGETVVRVTVCRDVLVVERTDERVISPGRTNFFASAECYRLQLSGEDQVAAKRTCVIDTFEFAYIDYSHQILSDHSGVYYAAYSRSSPSIDGSNGGVGVWDIATGQCVKRIAAGMLEGMGLMTDLMVVREESEHRVVLVGNDKRNNNSRRWDRFPGEWGYLSKFCSFPVEGQEEVMKGFVGRTKNDCPRESNLLTVTFKSPRTPGGLEKVDDEESEEAGLVLWELDDHSNESTACYYKLSGDRSRFSADEPAEPISTDVKYWIPTAHHAVETGLRPQPFTARARDALSFNMDFTGRNEGFGNTRLMLYNLHIQGFYPSTTCPGVMELGWESCLKKSGEKKDRGIYSANRNVTYLNYYGMEVMGDERAIVFLELKEGGMDLVVVVWDEPFHIPVGARKILGLCTGEGED